MFSTEKKRLLKIEYVSVELILSKWSFMGLKHGKKALYVKNFK